MLVLAFGLLGLIIGSFLNVLILRFGERSIGGRSACMHCVKQLQWFDMVPVFSWLALRGRCRSCHARISVQYPIVEATTGILFALAAYPALYIFMNIFLGSIAAFGYAAILVLAMLAALAVLVAIAGYDIRHMLIPDPWVWTFCALALIVSFLSRTSETSLVVLVLAGPVAALPLFTLWAISRGAWMGFGDVKLALGMGWLLGYPFGIVAVFFAFVIGAVISVGILMPLPRIMLAFGITRLEAGAPALTMKSEVPFGPFLIASTLIMWFALLYNIPIPLFS